MNPCCEFGETTMSAEILQQLNDEGMMPIRRLASLLNKSYSGAWRYFDTGVLDYHQLRTLVQHAGVDVALVLLNGLTEGTHIYHTYIDTDLDFDGDGDIDTDDVMGHAIKANEAHAAYLREALTTGTIDTAKLSRLKQQVINGLAASECAAVQIAEKQSKRHKLNGAAPRVGGTP